MIMISQPQVVTDHILKAPRLSPAHPGSDENASTMSEKERV